MHHNQDLDARKNANMSDQERAKAVRAHKAHAAVRNYIDVQAAGLHSLVLHRDGGVTAFGDNSYGQLGYDPAEMPKILTAEVIPVIGEFKVRQIATGPMHTLVLL